MRWLGFAVLALCAALAVWLWGFGGMEDLSRWAASGQRDVQNQMAGALRGIKAGQGAAFWSLMGLCFAYGFFHAAGPGHGKVLIGGYSLGRDVARVKLAGLAVASSLAQALTAVAVVYAGVGLFQLGRAQLEGVAEKTMAPVSYGAIALVGVWLGLRGVRRWWASRPVDHHEHHEGCGCGHAHGPDPEAAAKVGNWREAAVLIASIAIRPCTGAIFVLLLCWKLGIDLAGIAGAFVMGLGTASVTLLVAFAAHGLRTSALMQVAGGAGALRLQAVIEIAAGAIVCIAASQLLLRAL